MCNDKAKVMEMVKENGWALRSASEELRADKEVVLEAVRQNGRALQYASEALRADRKVVLEAVKQNWIALGYAAVELRGDDEIMLEAVKQDGTVLQYYNKETLGNPHREWVWQNFPGMDCLNDQDCYDALAAAYTNMHKSEGEPLFRNFMEKFPKKDIPVVSLKEINRWDREKILEAVCRYGKAIEYVSEKMCADKEIVLAAVRQDGRELAYASNELKTDKEIVLAAVGQNGNALYYASVDMKADKEVVLAAVRQNAEALKYASEDFRADKEVVLAAVEQNGYVLRYASDELRADKEVVLAAVKQNGKALQYADEKMRADKEIVLAAVESHGTALGYASEELRKDKELNEIAIKIIKDNRENMGYIDVSDYCNPWVWEIVDRISEESLQDDQDIPEAEDDVIVPPDADSKLWKDRDFVLETVKKQGDAIKFAKDFQNDDEVALAAVRSCGRALMYVNCKIGPDFLDKELVLEAVKQDGLALEFADERLKADKQVVLAAIRQNAKAVKFMDSKYFRNDKEVVLETIKHGLIRDDVYRYFEHSILVYDEADLDILVALAEPEKG